MYLWRTKIVEGSDHACIYLSLPPQKTLLYLRGITSTEHISVDERIYTVECVARDTVEISENCIGRKNIFAHPQNGSGRAVFLVTPRLLRTSVDPGEVLPADGRDLERFLGEGGSLDMKSGAVQDAAATIRTALPPEQKGNPYWLADGAFRWVKEHISYAIVPREIIERVARIMESLPDGMKNDSYRVLREAFPRLRDDLMRRASSWVSVDSGTADSIERAKKLMYDVSRVWGIFLFAWLGKDTSSASAIIKSGMAKCTGMAGVFVALARALGVPSDVVSGYAGFGGAFGEIGGHHAWALVYLAPYGWIEIDPTNNDSFDRFFHAGYGYECFSYARCDAVLIPDDGVPPETIRECREFVAKEQFSISAAKPFSIFKLVEREKPREALCILDGALKAAS